LLERGTDELGAVVQTQALRRAEHFDQLINGTMTRCGGRLVPISMRRDSRLWSSLTLKVRKHCPLPRRGNRRLPEDVLQGVVLQRQLGVHPLQPL
jgi:hypothetical protein